MTAAARRPCSEAPSSFAWRRSAATSSDSRKSRKTRLRRLSAEQVEQLLDYERRYQARPAYLTMLGNRLDTIRSS